MTGSWWGDAGSICGRIGVAAVASGQARRSGAAELPPAGARSCRSPLSPTAQRRMIAAAAVALGAVLSSPKNRGLVGKNGGRFYASTVRYMLEHSAA